MTNDFNKKEVRMTRIKRLSMRSMRRGTKEMDIILSRFWDHQKSKMDEDMLNLYEALLSENDQELYQWITGQTPVSETYVGIVDQIKAFLANQD